MRKRQLAIPTVLPPVSVLGDMTLVQQITRTLVENGPAWDDVRAGDVPTIRALVNQTEMNLQYIRKQHL